MSEASFDVLLYILSRLPAKSLLRLRCVCKAWKSIIDDPVFVKSHSKIHHSSSSFILTRNRYGGSLHYLSLDSLNYCADGSQNVELDMLPLKQIIHRGVPRLSELPPPSCNGLILIHHKNITKNWAIWNPLVQDFHLVPPPPTPETDLKYFLARCGFGYEERSDDYKVVRVDGFYGDDHYETRVYSLKSRSWRTIDFPGGACCGDFGAFLDGALHWRSRDGMVALDIRREVHRLVAPPPPPPREGRCWESLDALDGCLIWSYGYDNLNGMDAWVMKDHGTEQSLWTKLFSVKNTYTRGLRIVGYLKSKGQVVLGNGESMLILLHLENKCWREIRISSFYYSLMCSLSFAQFSPVSLVRLDNHKNRPLDGGVKRKRGNAYARSSSKQSVRFF